MRKSGTLFLYLLYLLSFRSGLVFSGSAEQRNNLYYANGILCDSISRFITQVGLILAVGTEEPPAYRLLRQRQEISTLLRRN